MLVFGKLTSRSLLATPRSAAALVTVCHQHLLWTAQENLFWRSPTRLLSAGYSVENDGAPSYARESYSKLPRLFVGTHPSLISVCSVGDDASLSSLLKSQHDLQGEKIMGDDALVTLSQEQSHHLMTVLRLPKKAKEVHRVRLFDNHGEEWLAEILVDSMNDGARSLRSSSSSAGMMTRCVERLRALPQNSLPAACWICVAAPKKKDRSRWLVEKCTELSVTGFVFLDTQYSEVPERFSKLLTYSVEAAEQSERLDIPRFVKIIPKSNGRNDKDDDSPLTKLNMLLGAWVKDSERFPILVCRERADGNTPTAVNVLQSIRQDFQGPVACVIGPEGGWSPSEEERFDQLEKEFPSLFYNVVLGPSILRTETAACAVAAAHGMILR